MWQCYGVHITVYMACAVLVYVLCQPVHSCIEPSLHQLDFIDSFLWRFVSIFFIEKYFNNLLCLLLTHLQLMCHPSHVCTDEWLPTASTLCPLSLSHKKSVGGKFQLCSMQNSNGPSSENFVTIGGCFERYTYHITALGWLKKKEKKKKDKKDEHLLLSTISGLPL